MGTAATTLPNDSFTTTTTLHTHYNKELGFSSRSRTTHTLTRNDIIYSLTQRRRYSEPRVYNTVATNSKVYEMQVRAHQRREREDAAGFSPPATRPNERQWPGWCARLRRIFVPTRDDDDD